MSGDKLPTGFWLVAGAGVGLIAVVALLRSQGDKINPTSKDNLVYQGVNAVGDVLDNGSDDASFSLGAWLYDITHPYDGFEYSEKWTDTVQGMK